MITKEKFKWISELSWENLARVQKILKIILDELELQGINRLIGNKIPIKKFEKEGFCYEEVKTTIERIDKEENIISIIDIEEEYRKFKKAQPLINEGIRKLYKEFLTELWGIRLEDSKNYLLVRVTNLDKLKKIKEIVDKKLLKIVKPIIGISKISLKSVKIIYNDNEVVLKIENQKCQLPPYKNEHYFCRAMYEYDVNEPVDWSIIYEKMTGYYENYYGKPQKIRENWRLVYDTMAALNKRIKKVANTDDDLFTWQEKTVRRNY